MRVGVTTKVPIGQLQLDRRNPRLVGQDPDASDESIIARLYRSAELDELLQSISTTGYLDIEPLVVVRESGKDGLTVLEGNRRLATLRLLQEPGLVQKIKASEHLRISVPEVRVAHRSTLKIISVYPVESRNAAREFIGFKHINGPAKWDAYAKARFAADWYKADQEAGLDLQDIANAIGDRHDTIKRMVSAIYVLEQARENGLFQIEDRNTKKFNFSHLYTALSRTPYMQYLGLDGAWTRHDPKPDQISQEKLPALRSVLVWLYGSKADDKLPIIERQNPDIRRLGEVLANAEGRHVLEEDGNLNEAYASSESVDKRFTASLLRARAAIRDTAVSLRAYDGRDQSMLDIAEDIKATADSVYLSMARKRREASLED